MAKVKVFRTMKALPDGLPETGPGGRLLGIRGTIDVPASGPSDSVTPGTGGVSVAPDSPVHLPRHRRPSELGGTSRDPLWMLEVDQLPARLAYRPDPANPYHGFIEPAVPMTLQEFDESLSATRSLWVLASPSDVS